MNSPFPKENQCLNICSLTYQKIFVLLLFLSQTLTWMIWPYFGSRLLFCFFNGGSSLPCCFSKSVPSFRSSFAFGLRRCFSFCSTVTLNFSSLTNGFWLASTRETMVHGISKLALNFGGMDSWPSSQLITFWRLAKKIYFQNCNYFLLHLAL